MKGSQIILGMLAGRPAAALMKDGQLDDLLLTPPETAPPAPGAIFRAVAERPLKGQGGMMMRLPDKETALFRGAKGVRPGQVMLVQVTSYAEAGKAVPVTDRVILKGRSVIVTPGAKGINISRQITDEEERLRLHEILHDTSAPDSGFGVIVRSGSVALEHAEIANEVEDLIALAQKIGSDGGQDPELLIDAPDAHELAWRDWPKADVVRGFEEHGVLDALSLISEKITLPEGTIFVEPTRALVAVDVNTGGDFSAAAGLKANIACARELPRALRLRGLGGQITLDLAPMPKKDRRQFEQVLRAAFKRDPIETALVGWTPLGHFELQRKRERLPLPFPVPLDLTR